MLRVLLTNDDGVREPGLLALAAELAPYCELTIVAPSQASSGSSHSLSIGRPLYIEPVSDIGIRSRDGLEHVHAWACSGYPTDCVMLALVQLLRERPPHLVLSGINNGCNIAEDMSYSGTLGAALEGAVLGVPSLAFSLNTGKREADFREAARLSVLCMSILVYGGSFGWHWQTLDALSAAASASETMDSYDIWPLRGLPLLPGGFFPEPPPDWHPSLIEHAPCFNINLPQLPLGEIAGIRWTLGGVRKYVDAILPAQDESGRECFWIGGEKVLQDDDSPGTDTHALRHGWVGVTPVSYDLSNRHESPLFRRHLSQRLGHDRAGELERGDAR